MIISICNDLTELKNNPKMAKGVNTGIGSRVLVVGMWHKLEKEGKTVQCSRSDR